MIKIICIGNRFAYPDNFGILIYESIKNIDLDGVEIIEGGVGGDNLALHFEDDSNILIVDYASKGMPKIISRNEILNLKISEYNHANSLIYFLTSTTKEYTIYSCNELFKEDDLDRYIDEILDLARGIDADN
jgi:Ni,Fe-hydrogenase maturation factor